jgi:hypothetical protein
MQYMLLIYADPATAPSPEQAQAEMPKWFAYSEELSKAGAMVGGDALQPTSAATTVRERGGERLVTDGPFAETKEQLGGYYLIDVPDLDAALDWASKIPNIARGSVEVRPVMKFD